MCLATKQQQHKKKDGIPHFQMMTGIMLPWQLENNLRFL